MTKLQKKLLLTILLLINCFIIFYIAINYQGLEKMNIKELLAIATFFILLGVQTILLSNIMSDRGEDVIYNISGREIDDTINWRDFKEKPFELKENKEESQSIEEDTPKEEIVQISGQILYTFKDGTDNIHLIKEAK